MANGAHKIEEYWTIMNTFGMVSCILGYSSHGSQSLFGSKSKIHTMGDGNHSLCFAIKGAPVSVPGEVQMVRTSEYTKLYVVPVLRMLFSSHGRQWRATIGSVCLVETFRSWTSFRTEHSDVILSFIQCDFLRTLLKLHQNKLGKFLMEGSRISRWDIPRSFSILYMSG